MYLGQIDTGNSVDLQGEKDGKAVSFEQKVLKPSGADWDMLGRMFHDVNVFCVLEPARFKGKLVNLEVPGMIYHAFAVVGEQPYMWKNAKVVCRRLPVLGNVNIVYSKYKGAEIDRRRNERIVIGQEGVISVLGQSAKRVVVRDISLGGVGLVMPKAGSMKVGDSFHLKFSDKPSAILSDAHKANFEMDVRVVRVADHDASRNVVGCKMIMYDRLDLAQFIEEKKKYINRGTR